MSVITTKERPILFSAPMVRALLAGTKTQTRRTIGPLHALGNPLHGSRWAAGPNGFWSENSQGILGVPYVSIRRDHGIAVRYYGAPGDRLWVRETWAKVPASAYCGTIDTAADGTRSVVPHRDLGDGTWSVYAADWTRCAPGRWRPSIHMPYTACRITLEITDVRVQRLQEIGEEDAKAEGVERNAHIDGSWSPEDGWLDYESIAKDGEGFPAESARDSYRTLWNEINGAGSWDANPWVWALSFKRAQP